jgi:hypothetical protein
MSRPCHRPYARIKVRAAIADPDLGDRGQRQKKIRANAIPARSGARSTRPIATQTRNRAGAQDSRIDVATGSGVFPRASLVQPSLRGEVRGFMAGGSRRYDEPVDALTPLTSLRRPRSAGARGFWAGWRGRSKRCASVLASLGARAMRARYASPLSSSRTECARRATELVTDGGDAVTQPARRCASPCRRLAQCGCIRRSSNAVPARAAGMAWGYARLGGFCARRDVGRPCSVAA